MILRNQVFKANSSKLVGEIEKCKRQTLLARSTAAQVKNGMDIINELISERDIKASSAQQSNKASHFINFIGFSEQ